VIVLRTGLGLDLEAYRGAYKVIDRRAAGLPAALQPMDAQSLEEITLLLSLDARTRRG
jgi:hypothetical protein